MESAITSAGHSVQPQCQFFVVRKKRLCRMTVRPGRQYCGEHEPQPVAVAPHQEVDKRIPCPNDPKHTCYVSKLEKHLAKCNARQTEDPPYIIRNINAPEDSDPSPRVPLKDVPADKLRRVIDKVNLLYDKYVRDSISEWRAPASHHAAVQACLAQADRGDGSRRHLRQASRLLQLAEHHALVHDDTCYVELGAGKGMLSYYMGVGWCVSRSRVLCVDRASLRHKRDNLVGERAGRVRADLRHLALHRAPLAAHAQALVGLAKHLCGVATDYAVRCVTADAVVARTRGAVLATCCHHRCERGAYVGAATLQELGISGEELDIMFGIVSWATCGDGRSRDLRLARDRQHRKLEGDIPGGGEPDLQTNGQDLMQAEDTMKDIDTDSKLSRNETLHTNNEDIISDRDLDTKKQKISQEVHRGRSENEDLETNTSSLETNVIKDINTNERLTVEAEVTDTNETLHEEGNAEVTTTSVEVPKPKKSTCQVTEQLSPLATNTREEVGRRAKALIDYGRVLYLRDRGFEASMCYYVPTTESLENVCIVAKKPVL